jgi:proteic killer suppression protein
MQITFSNKKLEGLCNDSRKASRELGPEYAKVLRRRLDDLAGAPSLDEFRHLPGDCHEYKKQDFVLSLNLRGGDRILFRPAHDPIPVLPDGVSLDWSNVTAVEVFFVGDPHGKRI